MVSQESAPRFKLPVNYWPARTAMFWWGEYSFEEVRRDFVRLEEAGISAISISLTWTDFQPWDERVPSPPMRDLEHTLDLADEHGVSVAVTLFPVHLARMAWLPQWAVNLEETARVRVMSGHSLTDRAPRNLFHDVRCLGAEHRLVREVMGVFDQHPAVALWVLGDRLTDACQPRSAQAYDEWLAELAEVARRAGARKPLWHGISARDLVRSRNFDPRAAVGVDVGLQVSNDWMPRWASPEIGYWSAFLVSYASALTEGPVSLRQSGTCDAGRAEDVEGEVSAVRLAGGRSVLAEACFDYSPTLRTTPPFANHPELLHCGLFRADGRLTVRGQAWIEQIHIGLPACTAPTGIDRPDPEERQRDPEAVAHLYCRLQTE